MFRPDLSLCADDLRMEIREALLTARRLGFRAVDLAATEGTISPAEMPRSAQRHFVRHLDGLGLRLSSLRGPVSGPGYGDGPGGERRLDMVLDIMRLARQLGVPVVSTTLGGAGDDSDAASRIRDALGVMAEQADRIGVTLAIETSGIAATDLNSVLRQIGCPKLTACCDSGAMLMRGDDPHRVADTLPGRIGLVRARDAVSGTPDAAGHEVAFGRGELDSRRFLAALAAGGFGGALVLSDTASGQAARNLSAAREQLDRLLDEPTFDG